MTEKKYLTNEFSEIELVINTSSDWNSTAGGLRLKATNSTRIELAQGVITLRGTNDFAVSTTVQNLAPTVSFQVSWIHDSDGSVFVSIDEVQTYLKESSPNVRSSQRLIDRLRVRFVIQRRQKLRLYINT